MGHRVHLGSFGFTWVRKVVSGSNQVRVGLLRRPKWSPGSFGFAWVHTKGHSVRRFIRIHVGSPRHWLPDSFEFACIQSGVPSGRRVQSGSLGFSLARLVVDGFIQV